MLEARFFFRDLKNYNARGVVKSLNRTVPISKARHAHISRES